MPLEVQPERAAAGQRPKLTLQFPPKRGVLSFRVRKQFSQSGQWYLTSHANLRGWSTPVTNPAVVEEVGWNNFSGEVSKSLVATVI